MVYGTELHTTQIIGAWIGAGMRGMPTDNDSS